MQAYLFGLFTVDMQKPITSSGIPKAPNLYMEKVKWQQVVSIIANT